VREYVGGYEDWLRQRPSQTVRAVAPETRSRTSKERPRPVSHKLSYKDQRELDTLPGLIEQLDQEQSELQARMADPGFFRQDSGAIAAAHARLAELDEALSEAYARWEALEALKDLQQASS